MKGGENVKDLKFLVILLIVLVIGLSVIFSVKLNTIVETIKNDKNYYSRDEWLENMSPQFREIFERGEENDESTTN